VGPGVLSSEGDAGLRRGYAGYAFDPVLGLAGASVYHVRNRVYDAQNGRWAKRDPLGYVDGPSMYEYCAGMALEMVDAEGLDAGWARRPAGKWPWGAPCTTMECCTADCLQRFSNNEAARTLCLRKCQKVHPYENCLTYALRESSGVPRNPGAGNGSFSTCSELRRATLTEPGVLPTLPNGACPTGCWRITAVLAPNDDYHFYRQEIHGLWTHKRGINAPSMSDCAGRLIKDPATADRNC